MARRKQRPLVEGEEPILIRMAEAAERLNALIAVATEDYDQSFKQYREALHVWTRMTPRERAGKPDPFDSDPVNFFTVVYGEEYRFAVELMDSAKVQDSILYSVRLLRGEAPNLGIDGHEGLREDFNLKPAPGQKTLRCISNDVRIFAERLRGTDIDTIENAEYRALAVRLRDDVVPQMEAALQDMTAAGEEWATLHGLKRDAPPQRKGRAL